MPASLLRLFLALYFAHLLTDFIFQTRRMVDAKKRGGAAGYLAHGAVYYLTTALVTAAAISGALFSGRYQAGFVGLVAIHLLIDIAKISLTGAGRVRDGVTAFAADQALHLLTVWVAACWMARTPVWMGGSALLAGIRGAPNAIILLGIVYILVVFAGGYVIRYLTKSLLVGVKVANEETPQLQNAGMYIGWLERFLILTAVLWRSPATIGLILTAKSIVRYPEMKSIRFAEYFLIGTLLSLVEAMAGGLFLLHLLHGAALGWFAW
jgi:Protein of unknown function (DUF3307)